MTTRKNQRHRIRKRNLMPTRGTLKMQYQIAPSSWRASMKTKWKLVPQQTGDGCKTLLRISNVSFADILHSVLMEKLRQPADLSEITTGVHLSSVSICNHDNLAQTP